jgi:ATP-binding cassette subfamily C (CFTR/MRP) protein 1
MMTGVQLRSALVTAIYNKSLTLSNTTRQKQSTGAIVNFMSNDTEHLQLLTQNLHLLWSSPLRIVVALILLFNELGVATIAGVLILLLLIPLQTRVVKTMANYRLVSYDGNFMELSPRRNTLKSSDERIKLMNEILSGIRIIKYYAWENSFVQKVLSVRQKEWQWLKKQIYLSAGNGLLIRYYWIYNV